MANVGNVFVKRLQTSFFKFPRFLTFFKIFIRTSVETSVAIAGSDGA